MNLLRSNEVGNKKIYLNGSDLTDLNELNEINLSWNTRHIVNNKKYPLEVILKKFDFFLTNFFS